MKAAVVGKGNVGTHLHRALSKANEVSLIDSRTLAGSPADSEVIIIAVNDAAIEETARRINELTRETYLSPIIVHTSGSVGIDILGKAGVERAGVFYPLQTFSRDMELDYSHIPLFIEAADEDVANRLKTLAGTFTDSIHEADSTGRRRLHLAAVLACNFVNHLWTLADAELNKMGSSIEVLRPLIEETVAKIGRTSPLLAQTGPARRHDYSTVKAHLEMLRSNPSLEKIYSLLSSSISDTYTPPK